MKLPRLDAGAPYPVRRWLPPAAILTGLAVVLVYAFGAVLDLRGNRLPGIDASVHYPWELFTRAALDSGRLPHWNPYLFAGLPHLADPQTIVLYPPAMLLRWLPPVAFLSWMAVLHMWIGGAGALFLGRVFGLSWPGAAAAALAVGLGGTAASRLHNGHLLVINTVAWLPWALAFSIQTVRRTSRLPHPGLALVLVLQFLAGYPQGSLYISAVVCLYFFFSIAWPETAASGLPRWLPLTQLTTVGLLAVGLSAFQLLPTARLVAEAARTAGISFEAATAGQWTLNSLATVFWPFSGVEREPAVRYIADRVAYVGWLLACTVPFAFLDAGRRRMVVLCCLLSGLAVAFAFGGNLPFYPLHYALFPGLREPGRLLFIATLGLALLGGLGLEQVVGGSRRREWRRLAVPASVSLVAMGSATFVALAQWRAPLVPPVHGWPWLPGLAIAGLGLAVVLSTRVGARAAFGVALLVTVVDLTTFSVGGATTVPVAPIETLERWLGPPGQGRVYSLCNNRIDSGGLLMTGRPTLTGPVGVSLHDYTEWLELLDTDERPANRLGPASIRRDLLDFANVSTVVACEPLDDPSLTLVSQDGPVVVYRNEAAWPRAIWTCEVEDLERRQIAAWLRRGRYEDVGRLADRPLINVRWSPGADDERARLEQQHQLREGVQWEDSTWRYVLHDTSPDNVMSLSAAQVVEDTSGLDRDTGVIALEPFEGTTARGAARETLVGTRPCVEQGEVTVTIQDQVDGHLAAEVSAPVSGFVFLSEPYYPERQAFVDGERVRTLKANLAFTAVPIDAGWHTLELRYVPTRFRAGVVVSGLTLAAWLGLVVAARRRRV